MSIVQGSKKETSMRNKQDLEVMEKHIAIDMHKKKEEIVIVVSVAKKRLALSYHIL